MWRLWWVNVVFSIQHKFFSNQRFRTMLINHALYSFIFLYFHSWFLLSGSFQLNILTYLFINKAQGYRLLILICIINGKASPIISFCILISIWMPIYCTFLIKLNGYLRNCKYFRLKCSSKSIKKWITTEICCCDAVILVTCMDSFCPQVVPPPLDFHLLYFGAQIWKVAQDQPFDWTEVALWFSNLE